MGYKTIERIEQVTEADFRFICTLINYKHIKGSFKKIKGKAYVTELLSDKTPQKGWLTNKLIKKNGFKGDARLLPRYQFPLLLFGVLQEARLEYKNVYGHRRGHPVFRLSPAAFEVIFEIFFRRGKAKEFMESDYYKDNPNKQKMIEESLKKLGEGLKKIHKKTGMGIDRLLVHNQLKKLSQIEQLLILNEALDQFMKQISEVQKTD